MDKRFSAFQHSLERYSHVLARSFDNFSEENCNVEPIFFVRKKTSIKLTQQRYYCCEKWLQFWTAACLNQEGWLHIFKNWVLYSKTTQMGWAIWSLQMSVYTVIRNLFHKSVICAGCVGKGSNAPILNYSIRQLNSINCFGRRFKLNILAHFIITKKGQWANR